MKTAPFGVNTDSDELGESEAHFLQYEDRAHAPEPTHCLSSCSLGAESTVG